MNRDRVAGNWKQFRGRVQERWGRLRGDAAAIDAAKHTQLAGSIQVRRGMSNEETARQLREFQNRHRNWIRC